MKFEDWCEATKRDEERAFERRRPWLIAGEILGGILLTMLYPLLFWLFLVATPPQSSAINDLEVAAEAARSDMGEGANREAARSDTEAMP